MSPVVVVIDAESVRFPIHSVSPAAYAQFARELQQSVSVSARIATECGCAI